MSNKISDNLLFDFYGSLLTDHQKEILDDYYNNDFSMSEIASNYKISKSAVSDLIKRCLLQLKDYENKLHLIKQNESLNLLIDKMEKNNIPIEYLNELKKISRG